MQEPIKKAKESCFVVATTLDESDEWSDEAVLTEYKEQQTVDRRFPVLKDSKRVGPVFLDRPDRVEALGYLLVMALLVYSVIERRAREALKDADEPTKLAGGPTSFRPSGRRVLERFVKHAGNSDRGQASDPRQCRCSREGAQLTRSERRNLRRQVGVIARERRSLAFVLISPLNRR